MEILFGLLSTGMTECIKLFSKKYGEEMSKKLVHGIVFGIVLVFTLLVSKGVISTEMIKTYVEIFATSYTSYQLIVKPVKSKLNA